jgi:hypothetical protein
MPWVDLILTETYLIVSLLRDLGEYIRKDGVEKDLR